MKLKILRDLAKFYADNGYRTAIEALKKIEKLGSNEEVVTEDEIEMMVNEYEYSHDHNQEDALYKNLCDLKNAYDRQKVRLEREMECTDYYANRNLYKDSHKGTPRFISLPAEDVEKTNEFTAPCAGKKARETQKLRMLK